MRRITIRPQQAEESSEIAGVIARAFEGHPHSDGSEPAIYRRLVANGEAETSLVAVTDDGEIVGHIVFSAVTIDSRSVGWCGLGPLSVLPEWQGRGVGSRLVVEGLASLKRERWRGCVVLGDPSFYGRFGFRHDPRLTYPGPPPEYFQQIVFEGPGLEGVVRYSPAFG